MAEFSHHDKTEAPTPRRRERAREEGQVAHSPELTSALVMFLAALALRKVGPFVGRGLEQVLLDTVPRLRGTAGGVGETLVWGRWFSWQLLLLTGGIVAAVAATGLLAGGLQVGLRLTPKTLAVNWSRLSPANGWKRLMSLDGVLRGVSTLMKLTLAVSLGVFVLASRWDEVRYGGHGSLREVAGLAWDVTAGLAVAIAAASLVWAAADYLYRWWRHEQQLRMTRQELKDELKNEEGDPQLRARRRSAHKLAAARKALQQVPEATVVITNPTHIAVALKYTLGQPGAPRVIAKGAGALARRIVQIAREHGVPVQEMKPLARALYRQVNIGQQIPVELYHVVAEILSQLYRRKRTG